jgi:hypothetical protein
VFRGVAGTRFLNLRPYRTRDENNRVNDLRPYGNT